MLPKWYFCWALSLSVSICSWSRFDVCQFTENQSAFISKAEPHLLVYRIISKMVLIRSCTKRKFILVERVAFTFIHEIILTMITHSLTHIHTHTYTVWLISWNISQFLSSHSFAVQPAYPFNMFSFCWIFCFQLFKVFDGKNNKYTHFHNTISRWLKQMNSSIYIAW